MGPLFFPCPSRPNLSRENPQQMRSFRTCLGSDAEQRGPDGQREAVGTGSTPCFHCRGENLNLLPSKLLTYFRLSKCVQSPTNLRGHSPRRKGWPALQYTCYRSESALLPPQWNQSVFLCCVAWKINLVLPMVVGNVNFPIYITRPNPLCPLRNSPSTCTSEVGYSIIFINKEEQ